MTLKLDKRNARKHSDRNKSAIRKSLETVGAGRSILVDADDNVLAGNGVLEQAEAIGLPVRVVESNGDELIAVKRVDLSGDKARQAATLDNLVADTSAFDYDAERLREALQNDPVSKAIAEQDEKLRELLKGEPKKETADAGELIDKAAELQKKWECVSGDIWTAAGHYWICGDCREFETWQKLLSAAQVEKVNGVFTSPPYAEQRKQQYGGVPTDKYVEWWNEVQANVRAHLAPDGSFFVNIKPHCENGERVLYVFDLVLAMQRQWAWKFVDELCWRKEGMPGVYGKRFRNDFEPIYHFSLSDCKTNFVSVKKETQRLPTGSKSSNADYQGKGGDVFNRRIESGLALPGNVIEVHMDNFSGHAARFPVALPEFFVKAFSDSGDVWSDPFLGSGTMIVAAHKNGRRGLGIERLEKYCAVICERIEKETGETPKRIESAQ